MSTTMKFVIELEKIKGVDLWKAKGFNTLIFDANGINKLQKYDEQKIVSEAIKERDLEFGDIIMTPNGTVEYKFISYSTDGHLNAINIDKNKYVSLSVGKFRVVRKWYEEAKGDIPVSLT